MGLTNKSEEDHHLKPTNSEVPDAQDTFHQSEEIRCKLSATVLMPSLSACYHAPHHDERELIL